LQSWLWNHNETCSEVVTDTENIDTLWWNIKNIKSNLAMSNYNEPNISLGVIWVTLLIYSVFRVVMSVTISAQKWCSVRLFLQLLVRWLICGICVCGHIVVSSTYVFVLFFLLCTICCQFLWMVHFVLPLLVLLCLLHLDLYPKLM
jgi:hypothetical protein